MINDFSWNGVLYHENTLWDYFNLPINVNIANWNFNFNVLPFRAYVKVWNDWYRDENLDEIADYQNNGNPDSGTPTADYLNLNASIGGQTQAITNAQYGFNLLKVNRLRDYFSSCLPFIQKGEQSIISTFNINDIYNNTSIEIPQLQITNTDNPNDNQLFSPNWTLNLSNQIANYNYTLSANDLTDGTVVTNENYNTNSSSPAYIALNTVDGYSVTPTYNGNSQGAGEFNITELRAALVKQHFNELMARGGDRYFERLLTLWGVKLNPLEIDRSELIGGFHQQIQINNIIQTAPATSAEPNAPVGSLKALSITTGQNPQHMNYAVEQPGIIIVCACVRSNLAYSQGIPKLFAKYNAWDFYNPEMNGISEQPIYTYELYANNTTNNGTPTPPDFTQIFGYNQPFADLKYKVNVASGYLSTFATDTYYNFYTYQNNLSSAPTLSNEWMYYPASAIQNTLLLDASNKSENINDFLADFYFNCKIERTIPAYSVPGVDKI